jgi:hypothetical protein
MPSKLFKTIYIDDKKEYTKFKSNVNSEYYTHHIGRDISMQDIDDYCYTFEVEDLDSYRIIGRTKISDTDTGLAERDFDK